LTLPVHDPPNGARQEAGVRQGLKSLICTYWEPTAAHCCAAL